MKSRTFSVRQEPIAQNFSIFNCVNILRVRVGLNFKMAECWRSNNYEWWGIFGNTFDFFWFINKLTYWHIFVIMEVNNINNIKLKYSEEGFFLCKAHPDAINRLQDTSQCQLCLWLYTWWSEIFVKQFRWVVKLLDKGELFINKNHPYCDQKFFWYYW